MSLTSRCRGRLQDLRCRATSEGRIRRACDILHNIDGAPRADVDALGGHWVATSANSGASTVDALPCHLGVLGADFDQDGVAL